MKYFTLILFLIGSLTYPTFAQPLPLEAWVPSFIDTYNQTYAEAMLQENFDAMAPYFAEEGWLMPEFQHTLMGKAHVQAYYKALFERFDLTHFLKESQEVIHLGEKVFEWGYFRSTLITAFDTLVLEGKYGCVWRKLDGQRLELETESWNYNHPLDFADRLRFACLPSTHLALQAHVETSDPLSAELAAKHAFSKEVITQGNASLWSKAYTDDGMFLYSFNPAYQGRRALDAFFAKHVEELPIFEVLDLRTNRIEDLGNGYVIEYASHIASWRRGSYSGVSTGKGLKLWRREENGTLKIFRHMAMYD